MEESHCHSLPGRKKNRGIYRRTRYHLRKTPERAESVSSDDNKSTDNRVISSGEQIRPSEPAVTLSVPKEAKQQEQAGEPSKAVATSTSLTLPRTSEHATSETPTYKEAP